MLKKSLIKITTWCNVELDVFILTSSRRRLRKSLLAVFMQLTQQWRHTYLTTILLNHVECLLLDLEMKVPVRDFTGHCWFSSTKCPIPLSFQWWWQHRQHNSAVASAAVASLLISKLFALQLHMTFGRNECSSLWSVLFVMVSVVMGVSCYYRNEYG